ncbi:MAG: glutathione S-transferase family protein [Myxococcota bacterium]
MLSLYYWPGLPGRGEYVRLVLEEAGVDYVDVARLPKDRGGSHEAIFPFIRGEAPGLPPLAPPILVDGETVLAQTASICHYLAQRHGLVPDDPASQAAALQMAMTIVDLVAETHDTHHPIAVSQQYEDQMAPAQLRSRHFVSARMPRFMSYFERVLRHSGGPWLLGETFCYPDLSLAHTIDGLRFAFPNGFAHHRAQFPRILAHMEQTFARPRIAAYRSSDRHLPFNNTGIFRNYPELDLPE